MIDLNFKEWLDKIKENATTSACVAGFARPTLPMVRRTWPSELDEKKKKKKKE